MEISRKSSTGLEQKIWLCEKPIEERDLHVNILQENENLLEQDKQKYSNSIFLPSWGEIVLALSGLNPNINPANLTLIDSTSYHVQAIRKRKVNDITPITVLGLILTSDEKLIAGIRGGDSSRDYVNLVPGGYVSNNKSPENSNPIFASFYRELTEETGLEDKETLDCRMIGFQTDPFFGNLCLLFKGKTKRESFELYDSHRKSFEVYRNSINEGKNELDARKSIEDAGFKNTDAWENTELLFIDYNSIEEIIHSGKIGHKGKEYSFLDNSIGALMAYHLIKLK